MIVNSVIYVLLFILISVNARVALDGKVDDIIANNEINIDDIKINATDNDINLPANSVNNEAVKPIESNHNNYESNSINEVNSDGDTNVVTPEVDLKPTDSPPDFTNSTKLDITANATNEGNINNTTSDNAAKDGNSTESEVEDFGEALILTPYVNEGRLVEARNRSGIDPDLFLKTESYAGFFTVNETYNSNLFFWYFPVQDKPVNETPWLIWLQGGPGASSLTGLFDEIGPFYVGFDGNLTKNRYPWSTEHSLLFIDNPVGAGYSFTNSEEGYTRDMETYGQHMYSALKQFLQIFPELRSAPLYVAGESYGGKYVPVLASQIDKNKDTPGGDINLQGLIVGNGYVDPGMITNLAQPFYYFGLLETEQMEKVRPLVEAFQQDIAAKRSKEAKFKWNRLITILLVLTHQKHAYNFLRDDLAVGKYIAFLERPEIRRALHVGNLKFNFINMTVNQRLNGDFLSSAKPLYEELLDKYRVLTYCGQLDQMLSCVLTSENYRTWRWNGTQEFLAATRYPFLFRNRLAGYHKTGGNLTEVVIRGAGHMAPIDAPAPTKELVARWIHRYPLSMQIDVFDDSFVSEYVRNSSGSFSDIHYF